MKVLKFCKRGGFLFGYRKGLAFTMSYPWSLRTVPTGKPRLAAHAAEAGPTEA
jgi:hypothetical protein